MAWAIDTWRAGWPSEASYRIGIVVIALITVGVLFDLLRRRRPA